MTIEGIRFIFTSFVANFQNFGVIAVIFIAMMGAGVAEGAGLMNALIRKLVEVAPRRLITFLIILVGGLSSVASDAGYLILIPLAASAFLGLRRNPLAGLAAGFAGVGGGVRRQHHHPADRRDAHRDDQRSDRAHRWRIRSPSSTTSSSAPSR